MLFSCCVISIWCIIVGGLDFLYISRKPVEWEWILSSSLSLEKTRIYVKLLLFPPKIFFSFWIFLRRFVSVFTFVLFISNQMPPHAFSGVCLRHCLMHSRKFELEIAVRSWTFLMFQGNLGVKMDSRLFFILGEN